ncbi:hypothetical protein NL676_034563 [Syzygium grande]|nr:hypothetical protein NL676_034563 [Syzygium grande]
MASALDTFCGQSYGAKQYCMLGIHMQRAMIVLLLASIPLAIISANAGQILPFFKQDPEISAKAGAYDCFMTPSIFACALLQCHVRFLQTQNNVVPMMISSAITTLLHIFICWLLVFKSGPGNKGAALANAISYWMLLEIYFRILPSCKRTWTGFSKEAFHGIPGFLKLVIPSAVTLCFESWSFEMVSGLLPSPKLETSVLSISTRVSNELGAGRPRAVRLAVCVSLIMVATEGLTAGALMILYRRAWGYLHSTEEEVVKYVGDMLVLIACSHCFNGVQSVFCGTRKLCLLSQLNSAPGFDRYY